MIAEQQKKNLLNQRFQRGRSHSHCESSTDAPTKSDRTLFVVRSTEAPFANKLSAMESLCFFAFAENNDWMVPTRPATESCDTV
jgi:hypothetical protein